VFFDLIEAPYKQERTTCLAVQKSMQIFSWNVWRQQDTGQACL
jgi:hypothetical protein